MSVRLKVERGDDPVPLGSMGDGMYRIFALTLSLVSSENGVLLVDEIDTGLHYKALTKMWRLVIETAKKLNVQVFATTHSWDCLASFQAVLTEEKEETIGSVFRLERTNDRIGYVAYTGEELAVAVDHDIEVR
jgi:AAA15 family ATPase/GTPase